MKLFVFFMAILLSLSVVQAKNKATTLNRDFTVNTVSVEMKNINDVGLIFVSHEDETISLAGQAAWTLVLAGKEEIELDKSLEDGHNFVIFVLWNKQGKSIDTSFYKKSFLDKWSYDFSLFGDGTSMFHQADEGNSGVGVAYYLAFNVYKNSSGYQVSNADGDQLSKVAARIGKINNKLQSKPAPESNSDIASMLSVALTGG